MYINEELGKTIDELAVKYVEARNKGDKCEAFKFRSNIIKELAPHIEFFKYLEKESSHDERVKIKLSDVLDKRKVDVRSNRSAFNNKLYEQKLQEDYQNAMLLKVMELLNSWDGQGSIVKLIAVNEKGVIDTFQRQYFFDRGKTVKDEYGYKEYVKTAEAVSIENSETDCLREVDKKYNTELGSEIESYTYFDIAARFVEFENKKMSESSKFNYTPLFYTEKMSLIRFDIDTKLLDASLIGNNVWRAMDINFLNTYICEAMTESPEWDRLFECEFKKYSEFTGDKKDENEICVSVSAAKTSKNGSRAYSDNGSTLKPKVLLNYIAAAAAAAGKKQYIKNKDDVSTRRSDYYNKILSFLRDKRKEAELN
ncbi:MAG: hypothetical protein IJ172_07840 [Ruminococcus sp.]|nr:hypothetical protein [Ruminococcus sp.]